MDLFKLLGTISIKNDEANKALDDTSKKGQETESKLSKAFGAVGKGAVAVGKTVATGLAVGATAMVGLTAKALSATGELEQNMGGSEAVFKEYAASMQETARNAFSTMGLATSDYLATANKMGSLFKGAGFEVSEAADMTAKAMQRAADVASIMGIDTASAMESIAGAAKGNFTMMDNLGVAMNDTTLQAYALSKGITKSTQEMTNQEKIGLAMEMFLEKTADYAGNYSKENETLAGSLGTAKAALKNFLDGSGDVDQLVTAFTGATNSIIDTLKTLAPRLVTGIVDVINRVTPMIPPLLQEMAPVIIEGAVSLINGIVTALPDLVSMLVTTALPMVMDGFVTIINSLMEALPQLVSMIASELPTLIPLLIDGLMSMIMTLCTMLPQIIQPILEAIPNLVTLLVTCILNSIPDIMDAIMQLVDSLITMLPQLLPMFTDAIVQLVLLIVEYLPELLPMLVDAVLSIITMLTEQFPQLLPVLVDALVQIMTILVEQLPVIIPMLIDAAFTMVLALIDAMPTILQALIDALPAILKAVWDAIVMVFKNLPQWFGQLFNGAVKIIKAEFSVVKEFFSIIWNGVKNIFAPVVEWFSSKFKAAKESVVSAFSDVKEKLLKPFNQAKDKIKEVADKIKGFFKGEISMPKIKVPKFSITPSGWKVGDLLKGTIPKLGITWHAKGAIMKEPTLFGYNPATGSFHGGGEAGDEAVAPIDTLQQYVKAAVQSENAVMVTKLDRIIDLLVRFFPELLEAFDVSMYLDTGVLVAETASQYDVALGRIAMKKGRGR